MNTSRTRTAHSFMHLCVYVCVVVVVGAYSSLIYYIINVFMFTIYYSDRINILYDLLRYWWRLSVPCVCKTLLQLFIRFLLFITKHWNQLCRFTNDACWNHTDRITVIFRYRRGSIVFHSVQIYLCKPANMLHFLLPVFFFCSRIGPQACFDKTRQHCTACEFFHVKRLPDLSHKLFAF